MDGTMVEFLLEQIGDPKVTARRMFGGHGLYRDGAMFALVYDEAVYVKMIEQEARTSRRQPFQPQPNRTFRTFREVFEGELQNRDRLAVLIERAQAAALAGRR